MLYLIKFFTVVFSIKADFLVIFFSCFSEGYWLKYFLLTILNEKNCKYVFYLDDTDAFIPFR